MSKRVKSLRFQSSEMVFIKIFLLKDYILTQNRMVFPSYSWLRKRIILLVHLDMLYHCNWWLRKRKGSQLYLNWGGEGERGKVSITEIKLITWRSVYFLFLNTSLCIESFVWGICLIYFHTLCRGISQWFQIKESKPGSLKKIKHISCEIKNSVKLITWGYVEI